MAAASPTCWVSVGSTAAHVATSATVVDIVGQVDLAPSRSIAIAVGIVGIARNLQQLYMSSSLCTNYCKHIPTYPARCNRSTAASRHSACRSRVQTILAGIAACSTVVHIGGNVNLTAVAGDAIAIGMSSSTLNLQQERMCSTSVSINHTPITSRPIVNLQNNRQMPKSTNVHMPCCHV